MTASLLFSILVRGAAFLALTGVGALALRRASAAHRHLAWTSGVVALLLLPAVAAVLPALDVAVLPAAPHAARTERPACAAPAAMTAAEVPTTPAAPDAASVRAPDEPPAEPASTASPAAAPAWTPSPFVLAWAAGALVVGLRLVLGALAARRLVGRSKPVADGRVLSIADEAARRLGATSTPSVRASDDVDSPLTVGAFRPSVLLPAGALSWPDDRLRLALLHEFAHVRRRDLLAELFARIAVAVHWPDPLAWLAVSRLRIERERASDDLVLANGNAADEYAGFLVSLARALRPTPTVVAATMAGGPQFERRVEAILDERHSRLAPSAKSTAVFALLASVALSFAACVQPTANQAAETRSPADSTDAPGGTPPKHAFDRGFFPRKAAVAVFTVALDGSGQYMSVSAALDAAPAGAVVRVGPGTFDEHLVVTKPVTIEGAGADQTTITSVTYSAEDMKAVMDAVQRARAGTATAEDRKTLDASPTADATHPTLRVRGARDVVVRGVTLTGRGVHVEGGAAPGGVVDLGDCGARLEQCAVVGGPGSGVIVGAGADAAIEGCLVAAVWDTGVVVSAKDAKARIADCDIRNCWQRGVTVGRGNRDVVIERCRISGSSWHGIRYDDAAPVVRGNLIFGNVRCGIYASGRTEGRIEGNLFFENGMSDIACWNDVRDLIEGDTFARSKREAVAVLGNARPIVRRNVFCECKTGVLRANVADSAERRLAIRVRRDEGSGAWRFAAKNAEWDDRGASATAGGGTLLDQLKVEAETKLDEQPVPGSRPPRYLSGVAVSVWISPDTPIEVTERLRGWLADAGYHAEKIEVSSAPPPGGVVEDNVFWKNGADFRKPRGDGKGMVEFAASAAPWPNVAADPGFVDPERRDFALSAASAARAAGAGAAEPVAFESPWPVRPEEAATAPKPEPPERTPPSPAAVKAAAEAQSAMERVKADILQISDAERRERGLVALGETMRADDPQVARPALAVLYQIRDVKYDKARFRPQVLRQLASADADTRRAAGYALLQVERDPGDLDRVLTVAESSSDTSDNLRWVALTLAGNRAEGRLAKLFVEAVSVDDGQAAMDAANDLRRMWVAPEVEDAVVAAWRRHPTGRNGSGMWPYIFGQITSPAREPRVRAVFEMIAVGDDAMRQLAGPAVTKPVDESARALASRLATDGIATAKTAALRRTYVESLRANGSRADAATLRALAGNEMVGDDLRKLAASAADELDRR